MVKISMVIIIIVVIMTMIIVIKYIYMCMYICSDMYNTNEHFVRAQGFVPVM